MTEALSSPDVPFEAARTWLFDRALPYWAARGRDPVAGGTVEELALDGSASDPGFRRVRVPCRQLYVWSHAALLGWQDGLALAEEQARVLIASAWQGPDQGWARRLASDNGILDGRPDLYDTSFAIFALSWYYRASGDRAALDLALTTLAFVRERMRHPGGLGYLHALPAEGPRIQNPHMHLLEACLAGHAASGEPRFGEVARELVGLLQTRFFDRRNGTLGEYFDESWNRLEGDKGRIVEPGHQLEWGWILAQAHQAFGLDVADDVRALIGFAETHGVDPAGAVRNSITVDGVALDGGSRTWPNTERVKAAVAVFEMFGDDPRPMLKSSLDLLLQRYLLPDGGWIDAFDSEGRAVASAMPVSTFYHVFLALAEAFRIEPAVAAKFR